MTEKKNNDWYHLRSLVSRLRKGKGKKKNSKKVVESQEGEEPQYELDGRFEVGIHEWIPCADVDVDVYFIQGLTCDMFSTWTAKGQTERWPKRILPIKLQEAGLKVIILTFGYDAYPIRWKVASSNRVSEHASTFLLKLTADRLNAKAEERPIIIVAHSLGGLICKQAILLSKDVTGREYARQLYRQTKGVIFMGTPHTDSPIADWAKLPTNFFRMVKSTNAKLLQVLQMDNEMLDSINMNYFS